jgi:nucleoside-diphosphate-sugar epimerase
VTSTSDGSPPGWPADGVVLITGGTGFLGTALARRLLAYGARVRILARSAARARELAALGAEIVTGDIADHAAVRAAAVGARTVYHLAGPLLIPGVPAAEYHRAHVLGTATVLDCCAESLTLERLVHCSTTGVLGITGERPAAEDDPFRPTTDYERAKAAAETEVRRAIAAGLPAVIARPGLVYGPGDVHLASFFQAIARGVFLPIGRRPTWLHPIYIDDMTEALIQCGQQAAALGECFHFAGTTPVPISELARAIARAEGARVLPGYLPLTVARAAARFGDLLPPRARQRAPLTSSRLEFLTNSRMYDVGRARERLGFVAATDLREGIAHAVAWYGAHGYLPARPDAASSLAPPRFAASRASEPADKPAAEAAGNRTGELTW